MLIFGESGHLDRGLLKKKKVENLDPPQRQSTNADLSFRTINSADQLSINGAVANWCEELAQQISAHASSSIDKSIAKANEQIDRPLAEIDCVTTTRSWKTFRKKYR